MTSKAIASAINTWGGRTTVAVTANTTALIAGEHTIAKKISDAKRFGVPVVNEDGLYKLIESLSAIVEQRVSTADQAAVTRDLLASVTLQD